VPNPISVEIGFTPRSKARRACGEGHVALVGQYYTKKQWEWMKIVATPIKDNRFSFQKIYWKSQISFSFFEKIVQLKLTVFYKDRYKNPKT
jgi:hypothetical protein